MTPPTYDDEKSCHTSPEFCPQGPLLDRMDARLERVECAIMGNGNPESGLVFQTHEHARTLRRIEIAFWGFMGLCGIGMTGLLFKLVVSYIQAGGKL